MLHGRTPSYIFNMFSVKMCVLIRLPDLLNLPSGSVCRLCFAIRATRAGPRSPVQRRLFLPRGKSNSHRLNKETLQCTSVTTFVFRALIDRGGAKSGHGEETVHSLGILEIIALSTHTASPDKNRKKYSTPSVFR